MSKGWISDRVNFSLIIAILAIVSIMLNSTSQNYEVVEAKINTNTNETSDMSKELKSTLTESPILAALVDTNAIIPETKAEIKLAEVKVDPTIEKVSEPIKVATKKWVTVTAYSSTVDQTDSSPFYTASGTHVHNGTIASNFLKFGTKVRFPSVSGDKIYIVEDRMNSRFNSRVDIWFPTRDEAKKFGMKKLEIEVLE